MKVMAMIAALSMGGLACVLAPSVASAGGTQTKSETALGGLLGDAIPSQQLGKVRARGDELNFSVANGTVSGNSVGANSVTGSIKNNQAINNNTGITTVFQNTGNNTLLQSSMTVNISVH